MNRWDAATCCRHLLHQGLLGRLHAVPLSGFGLPSYPIRSYYVPDPSKGAAPGVVKDSGDRDIEGKLELLKAGRGSGGRCRRGRRAGW